MFSGHSVFHVAGRDHVNFLVPFPLARAPGIGALVEKVLLPSSV